MISAKLNKGDKIGVVSPSNPVTDDVLAQFKNGVKFLEEQGFKVVMGEHVFSTTLGYAASPQEKAADLNRMFADAAIKAIICTQGGYTANACLPYLDWAVIRANPKIFLGISDITALLNALYVQTGLVTFHGNDVMWGFGRNPDPYDIQEFFKRLVEAEIGLVKSNRPRQTVRSGAAEGKLLGGNINCLLKLTGTPYWPDFTGSILFLEAVDVLPAACDHMLHQLKQVGVFDQARGVIIGYVDGLDNKTEQTIKLETVLLNVTAGYNFPILKTNDFGHNCPNTTLPVGGQVRVDADKQEVTILEPCVF
jgi:muramoyltetrapeptide carboxypeptidase